MSTIKEIFSKVSGSNAISMLKEDHTKVKEIFEKFEAEDTPEDEKRTLAEQALTELTIHAELEEKLFYPAVRAKVDDSDLMDEALEEHHVAKLLIKELVDSGLRGERFEAKFIVLAESVKHHIEEEEGEMLPKAQKSGLDFEQLGEQMMEKKLDLMQVVSSLKDLKPFVAGGRVVEGRRRRTTGRRMAKRRATTKSKRMPKRGRAAARR